MLRGEELIQLSTPRLVETEAAVTLAPATETTVLTAVGHASACDVWFRLPTAWELVVTLRLYARVADARVLLKTVRIDESHRSSAGGFVSGTAISVRGRPVTAFELTAESSSGVSNGQFMLNVWHSSESPLIVGGITGAAQQAAEERVVAHLALRNGTTPILAAGDASGRAVIAGPGVGGTPSGGVVTVQGHGASGALSVQGPGIGGTPSGGVVTVQGHGASGALSVQGPGVGGTPSGGVVTVQGHGLSGAVLARPAGFDGNFSLSSPVQRLAVGAGTTFLLHLWHPASGGGAARRVLIHRVILAYHGPTTLTGDITLRGTRTVTIGTPSGAVNAVALDQAETPTMGGNAAPYTTAPTMDATPKDYFTLALRGDQRGTYVWDIGDWGKPIILRANTAEGFAIRSVVETALSAANQFAVTATIQWQEV